MFIKALKLADLEGQDSHQHHNHQQKWINAPMDQILHFRSNTCKTKKKKELLSIYIVYAERQ